MSSPAEHVDKVLAREYWRCAGLAENARHERLSYLRTSEEFAVEEAKWGERRDEALKRLGGEVPQNPLPGEVEDSLKTIPGPK